MSKYGDIIAIGGGGFGRNPEDRTIEQYILEQSSSSRPRICFFPTASAENSDYITNYYRAFSKLDCKPTDISLFSRTPNLEACIRESDIIYIGGGNTKSMLSVFVEWGIDKLLLEAYSNGKILAGVSAGAICWFQWGITDSWEGELKILDCLDIISGCCCPHYNGEEDRKPSVFDMINTNKISSCYAIEDGAALHYRNNKLLDAVSFYKGSKAFQLYKENNQIIESSMEMINLY